jgi:hypothetical protein
MNITIAEWFLLGTNLVTALVLLGALRDARRLNSMFAYTMTKIADGEVKVERTGNGFLIKLTGEDNGLSK